MINTSFAISFKALSSVINRSMVNESGANNNSLSYLVVHRMNVTSDTQQLTDFRERLKAYINLSHCVSILEKVI